MASNGNISMISNRSSQGNVASGRMSAHRYSDYSDEYSQQTSRVSPRQSFQQQQQQMNLPTTISITAPSPMGSQRDMNRSSGDSQTIESQLMFRKNTNQKQQQHQVVDHQLVEMAAQMSLGSHRKQRNSTPNFQLNGTSNTLNNYNSNNNNNSSNYNTIADDEGEDNLDQDVSLRDYTPSPSGSRIEPNKKLYDAIDPNQQHPQQLQKQPNKETDKSRSQLIDELLRTINDDNFNEIVDFNNKFVAQSNGAASAQATNSEQWNPSALELANERRPKSAIDGTSIAFQSCSAMNKSPTGSMCSTAITAAQATTNQQTRPRTLNLNPTQNSSRASGTTTPSTFDNVTRRMSTILMQNFNKMSGSTIGTADISQQAHQSETHIRREKSSNYTNSLYVDNQVPARRHSDNTINIPRIQVALSSPQPGNSRTNLNQRASVSASKIANKWKLTAKTNRESNDKLSPNLSGALGYMRRHSSGNTTGNQNDSGGSSGHSNGHSNSSFLHLNTGTSPFKTRSSSNLGLDFLISNRSMKRRCSAASMLGHQTQRKAENLIDAGMKSVQNMFG